MLICMAARAVALAYIGDISHFSLDRAHLDVSHEAHRRHRFYPTLLAEAAGMVCIDVIVSTPTATRAPRGASRYQSACLLPAATPVLPAMP